MAAEVAEKVSAIALAIVVLAVLGGLVRLVFSHWTYVVLIVLLAVGAKYLWSHASEIK